jgi:hypothetical protein
MQGTITLDLEEFLEGRSGFLRLNHGKRHLPQGWATRDARSTRGARITS